MHGEHNVYNILQNSTKLLESQSVPNLFRKKLETPNQFENLVWGFYSSHPVHITTCKSALFAE